MNFRSLTGNDSTYHALVNHEMNSEPTANHFHQEYGNMMGAKNKDHWFNNHPLVVMSGAYGRPDTSFHSMSKNTMSTLRSSVGVPQGKTHQLINKLGMNKDFVRMFAVSPAFQNANMNALPKYNQGIKPGTTNESQSNQL